MKRVSLRLITQIAALLMLALGAWSLWEAVAGKANPRWPRHSHHDAGIGLTWDLKHTLPAEKRVYYGKLLKGRPLLVSLDLFPMFYALVRGRQRARDYRVEYDAGRLSHTARRIMDEDPAIASGIATGELRPFAVALLRGRDDR